MPIQTGYNGPTRRPVGKSAKPRDLNVLLIENRKAMREWLTEQMESEGWQVTACGSVFHWLQHCVRTTNQPTDDAAVAYDVVLSDIRVPGIGALKAIRMLNGIRCAQTSPPIVLITAFRAPETHRAARELGAEEVLDKPFDAQDLVSSVRKATQLQPAAGSMAPVD